MTTRRYVNSTDLSRSKIRGDKPRHQPRRRRIGAHFEALQPESAEHPVDVIVDQLPAIATLTRRALRRADVIKAQVRDRKAFIEYEDLRLNLRTEREIAYYNLGHEDGQVVGRLESLGAQRGASQGLAREVRRTVVGSKLRAYQVGMVLLELARAYLIGRRAAGPSQRHLGRPLR
jgi:hypothetical protein